MNYRPFPVAIIAKQVLAQSSQDGRSTPDLSSGCDLKVVGKISPTDSQSLGIPAGVTTELFKKELVSLSLPVDNYKRVFIVGEDQSNKGKYFAFINCQTEEQASNSVE